MIKRLFIAFAMLTAVVASASAQFASDGYIDRYDDDWLHRGYRGSVWGGGGPVFGPHGSAGEVYTSHGFQFNSWAYLGGGMGFCYHSAWDASSSFTLFANPQINIPTGSRFSPYIDMQIGFKADGKVGFHISPAIGFRYAITENWGINLSVAYLLQTKKHWFNNNTKDPQAMMFRLGVDFNL